MLIYWTLFAIPAGSAVLAADARATRPARWLPWFVVLLVAVIGLRFEVGVDWDNYFAYLDAAPALGLRGAALSLEPGYRILNWMAVTLGAGIWLVNTMCAALFGVGLAVFCRRLPNPWLAMTIAIPYMAIVMAMNYTRQGAAFGLVLLGLTMLADGYVWRFALAVIAAALFHQSAALLLPIGALASTTNRWWTALWIAAGCAVLYALFLAETQLTLLELYVGRSISSDGSGIRVAMNATAALVFLLGRNRLDLSAGERRLWTWFAFASLLFVPALVYSPSSTAVDRLALYCMPLQLVAFSRLPAMLRRERLGVVPVLAVVFAYTAVQFVWFTWSNYYWAWLPYQFYPLAAR